MPPELAAIGLLTSPSGAQGGGGSVPSLTQSARSQASAGLDSSGSAYDLRSATGDFIIGGGSKNNWVMIAAVVLGGVLLLRLIK